LKGDTVMSKQSSTKPIPSSGEAEFVRLVAKREDTIGKRLRKVTVKTLVFLFIFCLGFILSALRNTPHRQIDAFHQYVYAYDTEKKIEDYYKIMEIATFAHFGAPSASPIAREAFDAMVGYRPLVAVGPFIVFVNNNDNGTFSIRERSTLLPLVELESHEHSKRLIFISPLEKSWYMPRFFATLLYSEEGIYEKGAFSVHRENGTVERMYGDTKGTGVFDVMNIFEYDMHANEYDMRVTYHLNGLSWERTDEQPFTETLETDLDMEKVIE
jgi:hypothetical protein